MSDNVLVSSMSFTVFSYCCKSWCVVVVVVFVAAAASRCLRRARVVEWRASDACGTASRTKSENTQHNQDSDGISSMCAVC